MVDDSIGGGASVLDSTKDNGLESRERGDMSYIDEICSISIIITIY